MSEENTVASENQNDVATTTADTGTAPETTASETLLTASGNDGAESETSTVDESNDAQVENAKEKDVVVPEKYEFTDVEGAEIHDSVKDAFSDLAREMGLSQDAAQNVINKMAPAIAQANNAQLAALSREWAEQSRHDAEFGGKAFLENMGYAKKALDAYGTPKLLEILENAKLGNHPEFIRFFYKVGKEMSADKVVSGYLSGSKDTGDKLQDMANRLFPNG